MSNKKSRARERKPSERNVVRATDSTEILTDLFKSFGEIFSTTFNSKVK